MSCFVFVQFNHFSAMGYKNQDKSWRHGTWCSLHLTLNTESLGGGSVSRYSGKLVCTLSALELYFHRKTTQMVATVLKIPNTISFCQAKATWPQLRSLPIKTFLQFCSIMYLFLNRKYISVADIEWNILEFKSSVCGMDSKFISFITWSGHATECLIVGRGGGEEAVVWRDQIKAAMKTNINYELTEWLNDSCHCL